MVSRQEILRAVELISPLCINGRWLCPELALAASVIAQGVYDAKKFANPPDETIKSLEPWCVIIGVRPTMAKEMIDAIKKYK